VSRLFRLCTRTVHCQGSLNCGLMPRTTFTWFQEGRLSDISCWSSFKSSSHFERKPQAQISPIRRWYNSSKSVTVCMAIFGSAKVEQCGTPKYATDENQTLKRKAKFNIRLLWNQKPIFGTIVFCQKHFKITFGSEATGCFCLIVSRQVVTYKTKRDTPQ